MLKKNRTELDPQVLAETEEALASLSLEDLPVEDEPSQVLVGVEPTPEDLASRLMGQVIYQINRRIRELDARYEGGMNRVMLSERMGVPKSQVSRLLKAQKNTTLLTIAKAAFALGLTEAVLKLIPEESAADQLGELKAFVESDGTGCPWWPLTDRRMTINSIVVRSPGAYSEAEAWASFKEALYVTFGTCQHEEQGHSWKNALLLESKSDAFLPSERVVFQSGGSFEPWFGAVDPPAKEHGKTEDTLLPVKAVQRRDTDFASEPAANDYSYALGA